MGAPPADKQNSFLNDLDLRPLNLEGISDLEPAGLAIGRGSGGLEIAVDRKSTRLNSSHIPLSRMPSSA